MIEIGINKICKNFGYKQVLKNVSFEILTGNHVGIVGKNGSGKSTLFKMIMKKEFPDSGNITIRKQATIGYLEQIPTIENEDITVKDKLMMSFLDIQNTEQQMRTLELKMMSDTENITLLDKYAKIQDLYISQGGYEIEEKLNKIITGFKLQNIIDKPFSILSGGQKTVVNLAQLILTEPDILLLDEPLTSLDVVVADEMKKLLKGIKQNHILIFSTHIMELAVDLCDEIVILNNGKLSLITQEDLDDAAFQEKIIRVLKDGDHV